MYRVHESLVIGFRISNAAGELVHEWRERDQRIGSGQRN
jgi:hypothetical protein